MILNNLHKFNKNENGITIFTLRILKILKFFHILNSNIFKAQCFINMAL